MKNERGAAAVEFAIVMIVFFTLLFGIMDFGRLLFTWNSAQEATSLGVRMAVVCGPSSPATLKKMQTIMPTLASTNVQVDWYIGNGVSSTCTSTTCTGVAVSLKNLKFNTISPWMSFTSMNVPAFYSYLPAESMGADPGSSSVCS